MTQETLSFSYNWNGKLKNGAFTTIRMHNATKFMVGKEFQVTLNKMFLGIAKVVEIRTMTIEQINNYIGYLDTGYSAEKTKEVLKNMYKNKPIDWITQKLDFILLCYTSKNESKTNEN